MGAGLAAVLGLVVAVAHHLVDANLISPGDEPLYLTAIIGCGAGASIGLICVWFKEYRENAD